MLYGGSLGRYQEVTAPPKAVKERIENELGEVSRESWGNECGNWAKTFWKKIHACCPPVKASIIKFHVDTTLVDGRLIKNQANEKRFRNF